ncbi:signal recognition particle-docking protein FtsY [Prochlorococcus sp. MIT 1307]|uniref:signal recognition particle-docking protein FtsY n=1 Tax=Prochlorococcus sp. MIT 1307 TaxID=3096219 RepID=UPI002A762683|nr:signal recognition particle-docking protein FtsY [Prochlorococcus sp. MIT 1307]
MIYDEFKRKNIESVDHPVENEKDVSSPLISAEQDSLQWAKDAFAKLKEQQELEKKLDSDVIDVHDFSAQVFTESSKKVSKDLNEELIDSSKEIEPSNSSLSTDNSKSDDFEEVFTWSAEVLAAQGRKAEEVSLEELDWLGRLRKGLEKSRQSFVAGLLEKLGDDPLTPEVVDDLETLLLRADAGVEATDQILEALRRRLNEEVVDANEGLRFLKEKLCELLDTPIKLSGSDLLVPEKGNLNIWLLVGVNGVGKTTTLGKLANLAVRSGYSALIAAADTFRAAAVEQVKIWGDRSGISVIANTTANADPAAVVFDAIGAAKSKGVDLLFVDTAGRLQTKHNLMEELQKVRRIIDRLAPEAKVESLLVLDSSQGQNGLRQAMAFAKSADLTGVVITKLDGTSRGGVALAVSSEAKLPIRFIGAGEGIRDLRPFKSFEFVEALLAKR